MYQFTVNKRTLYEKTYTIFDISSTLDYIDEIAFNNLVGNMDWIERCFNM